MNKDLMYIPNDKLLKNHKTIRTIQWVFIGIMTIILVTWVVLGYWADNLAIFIIQIVGAFLITFALQMILSNYKKEIIRRGKDLKKS